MLGHRGGGRIGNIMLIRRLSIALFALSAAASSSAQPLGTSVPQRAPERYCNPIPLPDYPVGRRARDIVPGEATGDDNLWLLPQKEQYRELADPTALWHEGKWYLYPSCDMAWVSSDEGRTWEHRPLNIRDVGYAPTVVRHAGRFLLLASDSELYASASPLGPFEKLGPLQMPKLPGLPGQTDPMLFSDDDGRLYYYWGCTPRSGIWAVELDAANPVHVIGQPREVIPFQPEVFPWERLGNWNQDPETGWMEGAWMVKHRGRYYLTYSSGGTQYRGYAMGCYRSGSPLGPFTPQKRNPILRTTAGLVTGTAHGSIVAGPRGRLWAFYTVLAGVAHGFERRLGFDVSEVDEQGDLFVPAATSTPQALPAADGKPAEPWLPLNGGELTVGSSNAPNLGGRFAVDDSLLTWWQPAAGDTQPILTTRFSGAALVHAVRIAWRDVGLDTAHGNGPGPFRYRVEAETSPGTWTPIVDRSASTEDFLVDYRECAPTLATRARLVVLGGPRGIAPAVADLTVFGVPQRTASR
jgi:hypothetical protein